MLDELHSGKGGIFGAVKQSVRSVIGHSLHMEIGRFLKEVLTSFRSAGTNGFSISARDVHVGPRFVGDRLESSPDSRIADLIAVMIHAGLSNMLAGATLGESRGDGLARSAT